MNQSMTYEPRIEILLNKKLIGMRCQMSIQQNSTRDLWHRFMSSRNGIKNSIHPKLFSVSMYPMDYFQLFNPKTEFEKWACIEVSDFDSIPMGFESLILTEGTYAVFHYKGSSSDHSIFQYIFGTWLPQPEYTLDQRPHFEILGEKYKNNDFESEEEIWIPIKSKFFQ